MNEYYVFTFGQGYDYGELRGKAVKIYGTYDETRAKIFELYGKKWCGQYSGKEWKDWIKSKPCYPLEEIIKTIGEPSEVIVRMTRNESGKNEEWQTIMRLRIGLVLDVVNPHHYLKSYT